MLVGPLKLAGSPTLTGSDNNGLPHSVEPAVEANYVFSFVGETQRLDECGDGEPEIVQDDWGDSESVPIKSLDTERRTHTKIPRTKELKLLSGERLGWRSSRTIK